MAEQSSAPVANTFTPEEIAALEAEHKRVGRIPGGDGAYEIVIRKANKPEWRMFRGNAHDDDAKADAEETLVTQCCGAVGYEGRKAIGKEPSRALLAEVLNDWPQSPDDKNVSALIKKLNGGVGSGK